MGKTRRLYNKKRGVVTAKFKPTLAIAPKKAHQSLFGCLADGGLLLDAGVGQFLEYTIQGKKMYVEIFSSKQSTQANLGYSSKMFLKFTLSRFIKIYILHLRRCPWNHLRATLKRKHAHIK